MLRSFSAVCFLPAACGPYKRLKRKSLQPRLAVCQTLKETNSGVLNAKQTAQSDGVGGQEISKEQRKGAMRARKRRRATQCSFKDMHGGSENSRWLFENRHNVQIAAPEAARRCWA